MFFCGIESWSLLMLKELSFCYMGYGYWVICDMFILSKMICLQQVIRVDLLRQLINIKLKDAHQKSHQSFLQTSRFELVQTKLPQVQLRAGIRKGREVKAGRELAVHVGGRRPRYDHHRWIYTADSLRSEHGRLEPLHEELPLQRVIMAPLIRQVQVND